MGERTESEPRPDEAPRRPACPMCGSSSPEVASKPREKVVVSRALPLSTRRTRRPRRYETLAWGSAERPSYDSSTSFSNSASVKAPRATCVQFSPTRT